MAVNDILPLSMETASRHPAPDEGSDSFAFIDLARLGRTDWWSSLKALIKIVFWWLACCFVAAIPIKLRHLPVGSADVLALAAVAVGWTLGLRGALKSQRRPFLSLVSTDGRLRLERCCLGAALWLVGALIPAGGWCLYKSITAPAELVAALRHFSLPHASLLAATLLCIALIPIQAAAEELVFRGWLTQTLGQFLRSPPLLVFVVAIVFALGHGSTHGRYALLTYAVMSVGASMLTLFDQRIELAIGIHTANNVLALLFSALLAESSSRPTLFLNASQAPWWAPILTVAQFVIVGAGLAWLASSNRLSRRPDDGVR
jgi:uncharacterized protein